MDIRVSFALKFVAAIILLQGIFVLAIVVFGNVYSQTPVVPVGLVGPIFAFFGLAEIATSIGLWMSKKIAVYSALIIGITGLLVNLINAFSEKEHNLFITFFIIFFGIVIYLSISCIIKNRQQVK
jgi:hypothetical protein